MEEETRIHYPRQRKHHRRHSRGAYPYEEENRRHSRRAYPYEEENRGYYSRREEPRKRHSRRAHPLRTEPRREYPRREEPRNEYPRPYKKFGPKTYEQYDYRNKYNRFGMKWRPN